MKLLLGSYDLKMKLQPRKRTFIICVICVFVAAQGLYFWQSSMLNQYKKFLLKYGAKDKLHESRNVDHPKTLYIEKDSIYVERRRTIDESCRRRNRTVSFSLNKTRHAVATHNRLIYYCPVTKAGSTFWKRVLTVIESQGKYSSPFQLRLGQVHLLNAEELSEIDFKRIQEKGKSFMFVRDPYARIFSGYENKLYHSNLLYWKHIGTYIIRYFRKSNDAVYKNYGFDVTFPEFIKFLLTLSENNKYVDIHFTPMVKLCDPCNIHFQYIGKMETFKNDTMYLLSKLQKQFGNDSVQFHDFRKESILDTAKGRIKFLFEAKKIVDEIRFPFEKIMLRTWRDLQIRGYISKFIKFPYEHINVNTITKEDFIEEVRKAVEHSDDRQALKRQREEALIQAYRQVPKEDMERLRKYVLEDCLIFGYDDRPRKLFDRPEPFQDDFLYLDGLEK